MKKIALILINALLLASCSDFLKEEPRDEMSSGQFFSVPEHAYSAVNSLYRNGGPQIVNSASSYGGSRSMLGGYMSGYFDNEYKGQEPHVQNSLQLTLDGRNTSTYLTSLWGDMYRGISRANNAIKYIPETPGLSAEEANNLLAEAKFFRAFTYFYLVKMFGGVPVITDPYESLEDLYIARGTVKEVYDLIVEDLEFAANQDGLGMASMGNNEKRISQSTAAALLSEVYLTMSGYPLQEDHYEDAAFWAKEVINSGAYALEQHDYDAQDNLIANNSAYNKIRKSDVSAGEYVYFIEYQEGISTSSYPVYCYPTSVTSEVAYSITNGGYLPMDEFYWAYDPDSDLRIQEKQFFHSQITGEDGSTIDFPKAPYYWHDDLALSETANSGKDIPVMTYSNVLLIAAEAIAQSEGVTDEAINYLSAVRGRAYWEMDENDIKQSLNGLSVIDFTEEVWKERFRELVFEFTLWDDVQRTRKFPVTSASNPGEISFVDAVGANNILGKIIEEKHLLFPLPETELQRNPELEQNPDYNN
ncbi:RagB/SusD family nutrient uptake outer membrane protein [Echinicola salinicaeni]|uniref:RagB/SusD family nutrient uptake outer membrane protein n=1 Tax=Echinicola salinicaeni TaxID=2762757 RepID=UPI001647E879|nr:RagB/SusD family nutrient uptake outer membrane protein [Echinicola salinicaeni]